MHKKFMLLLVLVAMLLAVTIVPTVAQDVDLSIIWFAWPPCDLLADITSNYPDANVTVTCVPIGQWRDQIFADFAAQGGADLPILDSQFMGEGVAGGHLVELTDFLMTELPFDDYNQTALRAYAEVPQGSGQFYSVPMMTDTRMLVYRADVFAEAGFEPPTTWSELLEQAQFFKESDLIENGFATHWINNGDLVQTSWNHILWSFGGDLWDPETYQVEGVLNNEIGVRAVEFAQQLLATAPTGAEGFGFDETVGAMCNGTTAMVEIWYGFGGAFTDPTGCPYDIGFAVVPGEEEHYISLGGMGISVSVYSPNQEAALALISWLQSDEIQLEWASRGGFPGRESILASDEFLNAAPYDPSFAEAFTFVRDFWNLPEYSEMLSVQGEYLNLAISGQMDPQEALDEIAAEHQAILDEAYPDGPPSGE
jgi:multiple sugar transport system substrate-binding protein